MFRKKYALQINSKRYPPLPTIKQRHGHLCAQSNSCACRWLKLLYLYPVSNSLCRIFKHYLYRHWDSCYFTAQKEQVYQPWWNTNPVHQMYKSLLGSLFPGFMAFCMPHVWHCKEWAMRVEASQWQQKKSQSKLRDFTLAILGHWPLSPLHSACPRHIQTL